MEELKERILKEGKFIKPDILKVDSFLNHMVDAKLLRNIAMEFKKAFSSENITKIVTIESSGISIAAFCAYEFGVPFVFAKKYNATNLDPDCFCAEVFSFTKQTTSNLRISKKYITKDDNVLIIDDFLANGKAILGLYDIIRQAGAKLAGCGIVIEKSFQPGRKILDDMGIKVVSLARISSIEGGKISFLD